MIESRIQVMRDDELPAKYAAYRVGDNDVWHGFARAYDPSGNTFLTLHVGMSYQFLRSQISRVLFELQEARPEEFAVDADATEGWGSFWKHIKKIAKWVAGSKLKEQAKEQGLDVLLPGGGASSEKAIKAAKKLIAKARKGDKKAAAKIKEIAKGFKGGDEKDSRAMYLLAEQNELAQIEETGVKLGSTEGYSDEIGAKKKGGGKKMSEKEQRLKRLMEQRKKKLEAENARRKKEAERKMLAKVQQAKQRNAAKVARTEKERAEQARQEELEESRAAREDERTMYQQDAAMQQQQAQLEAQQRQAEMQADLEAQRMAQQQQLEMMRLQASMPQPVYAQPAYADEGDYDEGDYEDDGGGYAQGASELEQSAGSTDGTEFEELAEKGWAIRRALGDYVPGDE